MPKAFLDGWARLVTAVVPLALAKDLAYMERVEAYVYPGDGQLRHANVGVRDKKTLLEPSACV